MYKLKSFEKNIFLYFFAKNISYFNKKYIIKL